MPLDWTFSQGCLDTACARASTKNAAVYVMRHRTTRFGIVAQMIKRTLFVTNVILTECKVTLLARNERLVTSAGLKRKEGSLALQRLQRLGRI